MYGRAMTKPIRNVAVLGAGVMGAGIAAHVANAGLPVLLLDMVPPDLGDSEKNDCSGPAQGWARNRFAAGAVKTMLKAKPAPFFSSANARLVTVGNLEDDLARAASCDLVIEAIIERLDIKRSLFERIEPMLGERTILASNTSGLRIADMIEGRGERFRKHFLVTHFFNPPRYMKLLEIVAGPDTHTGAIERATRFGRETLGKGIVRAKDRPNFVANRVGAHSMMTTIHLMLEHGLSPEDIDNITGQAMGHPKSATFRTGDLVGLDTLVHVVDNCHEVLVDDEDRAAFEVPGYIRNMLEKKQLGNKTRGGFYKKTRTGFETLDPNTGEYRQRAGDADIKSKTRSLAQIADLGARLRKLVATEGVVGEVAWKILSRSMAYAARRVGEITDDIEAIDNGMKWGYSWELGPFETWDALGFAQTTDRMKADGIALPKSIAEMRSAGVARFYDGDRIYDILGGEYRPREIDPREVELEILRRGDAPGGSGVSPTSDGGRARLARGRHPVVQNKGAEAWDLGDGVLGLTFKTKANSIDPDIIQILGEAADRAERDFQALLITNRGEHFCVGANLFLVGMAAGQKNWDQIRDMVRGFQDATQRLKYSTVPVVAAPHGMAVGGGMELCFASDAVQAAAETYCGLVEVGVGLIPGGAGTLNMLWRALEGIPDGTEYDVYPFVTQVFKNIATARVATSAGEAKEYGYFRSRDGVSFDRARQLYEAKTLAVSLAETGYHPPVPRAYRLPGESGIATLQMLINTLVAGGFATEHDGVIAGKLAAVLCGGVGGSAREVTEEEMLELEREAFVSLCGEKRSQQRMQHMLMKNKPLRN